MSSKAPYEEQHSTVLTYGTRSGLNRHRQSAIFAALMCLSALLTQSGCATVGSSTSANSTGRHSSANSAPLIVTQPASQTVNSGQTATFSVTASGAAPLSYQWEKNGAAISGATSSSYTTPPETTSAQFAVVVSNSVGIVTSSVATLTVNTVSGALTVNPGSLTLAVGNTQAFVISGSSNAGMTWTVNGAGCISAGCGTISANGLYVAPMSVPSPPTVTVKATNVADPSKSASASVTIVAAAAILLSLSPTSASVATAGTQTFKATVTGTSNTAVTWNVTGPGCSGSACGSLSTSGLTAVYSAPVVAPSPAIVNVLATSVADPSKSASAVVAFALQIASGGLPKGQVGVPFRATLTGTGGVTPYKWTLSGAMPSGLTLNASSGAITGTPTQAGTSTFTLLLTDSTGQTAQQSSSITIAPAGSSTSGPPAQTLSLVISGTGINQTATVESPNQFRLVFEAYDNWGLSQWYDLVNDPSATTNLAGPVYAVNGPSNPCAAEPGLQNMVFYGDNDAKLDMREAGCAYLGSARSMTVLSSSPSLVVIQTTGHPMTAIPNIDTNVTGTITYYILPNGQIYVHNTITVGTAQDLSNGGTSDLFISTMELEDPTQQGTIPPDSQGWIRATATQNPYSYVGAQENYIFAYWGPNTPSPYTNYTKASIMLVPSPNNPTTLYQIIHSWSSGPGYGVIRWGYRISPGPNMSAGQTIAYDFLMQLGTQGSSVLPNINSSAVGGPIANNYRANPTPPGVVTAGGTPTTGGVLTITPSAPAVNQGGTINFTEAAGDAGTWSCAGTDSSGNPTICSGSINSSTGVYTAPATVTNQQTAGGMQLLPNNHIFNTRVDSLPVNSNSATWIAGAGTVPFNYLPSFPINYANGSTPTESEVFYYTSINNGTYQIPAYPFTKIEGGWLSARQYNPFNSDHHLLVMDTTNGTMQEMYQYYPAGTNTGQSCPLCTSQSGQRYSNSAYPLPVHPTTDAAGLDLWPLLLRMQEVEQAIATSSTINHALRFTLNLGYCASSNIWPATSFATDGGTVPFGARARLKSSFNISGYSATAQILLTQLKQYGIILADGGYGWQSSVETTRWPKSIMDAFQQIQNANIAPSNFEFVDESGLMLSVASGETTANRETVKFTRTSDSATASVDVVLQGVAVTLPNDVLYIQAGMTAQQLSAFVNIGSVTWTMSPTVGTLTSGGLYTPPATQTAPTSTTITATSTTNSAVAAQMTLVVMPNSVIRLAPAHNTSPGSGVIGNYTDSLSHVWYAGPLTGGDASCNPGTENCYIGYNNGGSWPSTTDIALYQSPMYSGGNDLRFDFIVPNGTYQITAKFANNGGGGADMGSFVIETQGTALSSPTDVYSLVGNNQPYDYSINATVINNKLSFVLRSVSGYAPFISALQIVPVGTN
jgi:Putative Ig domain/Malectin domain